MSFTNKIISVTKLQQKLSSLRKSGKTIAFTNGCFDLMHLGHVTYLEKAKGKGRVLIVGLNSDKSIRRIKQKGRPICPEKSRAGVLAALSCVDFVVLFDEDTPYNLIKAIKPDVLIKGADYKGKEVVGSDIAKKVELIKFIDGFSTSRIVEKILKSHARP